MNIIYLCVYFRIKHNIYSMQGTIDDFVQCKNDDSDFVRAASVRAKFINSNRFIIISMAF